MNIESVKLASPPQRAPLPETPPKVERITSEQSRQALAAKSVDASQSLQAGQDQNPKDQSTLSIEDAVKRLADFVAPTQSQISFSIDETSGVNVVKILDTQSKEVIRQFPSEEAIALAQALDKLQGLLIKDKA